MTLVLDIETYIYAKKFGRKLFSFISKQQTYLLFHKNTKYVNIYLDKTLRTEWSGKVLPNLMAVNATKISNC